MLKKIYFICVALMLALLVISVEGKNQQGKIAFVRDRAIWIMNANGKNQIKLTEGGSPRWSPDGKRIAFRAGNGEIYIMDADGKNQTRLTDESSIRSFCWSPDSKKITFVTESDWKLMSREIYVMNADGNSSRKLTNDKTWKDFPCWSPDSRKITFTSGKHNKPDSGYEETFEIYVMDADGKNQERLTKTPPPKVTTVTTWVPTVCSSPSWSPEGNKIAYVSYAINRTAEIYVMNANGRFQEKLTNNMTIAQFRWSPDGKKILFISHREYHPRIIPQIYVIDLDGKNRRKLAKGSDSCWSPAGKKIAFASNRDGQTEIYIMDANGSNQKRLTTQGGENPAWQPVIVDQPKPEEKENSGVIIIE